MSNNNIRKPLPKYSPEKMWKPLGKLMASHFDATIRSGDNWAYIWEPKRLQWDEVLANLRAQCNGETYGRVQTFGSLRFIENLAIDDDVYFRLAAALLSAPLQENFVSHGGFLAATEDFYLQNYGCAPAIYQGDSTNRVLIRIPKFWQRLGTGHPSPRRLKRDFQKLTRGLWSFEFNFAMDQGTMIIEGWLPEGNTDEPYNPEFVQVGRELLAMAAVGGGN